MSTFNSTKMDLKLPQQNTSHRMLQSTNFCKNGNLDLTVATAIPEEESCQKPNYGDGKLKDTANPPNLRKNADKRFMNATVNLGYGAISANDQVDDKPDIQGHMSSRGSRHQNGIQVYGRSQSNLGRQGGAYCQDQKTYGMFESKQPFKNTVQNAQNQRENDHSVKVVCFDLTEAEDQQMKITNQSLQASSGQRSSADHGIAGQLVSLATNSSLSLSEGLLNEFSQDLRSAEGYNLKINQRSCLNSSIGEHLPETAESCKDDTNDIVVLASIQNLSSQNKREAYEKYLTNMYSHSKNATSSKQLRSLGNTLSDERCSSSEMKSLSSKRRHLKRDSRDMSKEISESDTNCQVFRIKRPIGQAIGSHRSSFQPRHLDQQIFSDLLPHLNIIDQNSAESSRETES